MQTRNSSTRIGSSAKGSSCVCALLHRDSILSSEQVEDLIIVRRARCCVEMESWCRNRDAHPQGRTQNQMSPILGAAINCANPTKTLNRPMFDNGRWTAGTLKNHHVADKPHSFNQTYLKTDFSAGCNMTSRNLGCCKVILLLVGMSACYFYRNMPNGRAARSAVLSLIRAARSSPAPAFV